ncbi:hypothetical protein GFC29_2294 [Anoxybacillus sp. B7M1]|jgi:hypothetical protein|uniref:DUF2642 domain-containing protein n=1 Tax=Anoxybacteroides rupiense TaxID=311460 RepID=A0ABD5IVU5_9BACL|nr:MULTISPECIES: hypothetical protein [Anoxybacillus]ANB56002.1 hypothetical protein GFC28_3140 [Anoxybacillus sp. B2M1]ANB65030.1 hypothetical protein GFC29_2294 [Anoxybacillus sp. B7M1]KXG09593.1 hypothetical protein AT864_02063 [Anoxybacillus sp. P3H1B]MBS2772261.1 hypothetical protein [Anoxybacillus rupiensis]MDE8564950.1 hypothetical protein [Anoxybacillus rupiensis]
MFSPTFREELAKRVGQLVELETNDLFVSGILGGLKDNSIVVVEFTGYSNVTHFILIADINFIRFPIAS